MRHKRKPQYVLGRAQRGRRKTEHMERELTSTVQNDSNPTLTPWVTVREAAARAKCGERSNYNAVRAGRLRAARLGGRRELPFLPEWIDAWLIETSTPVVVNTTSASAEIPGARR